MHRAPDPKGFLQQPSNISMQHNGSELCLLALATIGVYSFFFQLIVVVIQSLCHVFVTPFF